MIYVLIAGGFVLLTAVMAVSLTFFNYCMYPFSNGIGLTEGANNGITRTHKNTEKTNQSEKKSQVEQARQ